MGACPNLFYLIYQHTAFPFTWELSAVTLVSASTLLLMLMRPEVWRGTSPCFISVLITEYTIMQYYPSTSRKVLRLHSNRETNKGSDSRLQSISYSHFTHLVPSISFFFSSYPSLLASRRCKRLADRTRWYFVWWWAITLSFKDWKILGFSKGRWTFSNDSVYNPSLSDAYPNK